MVKQRTEAARFDIFEKADEMRRRLEFDNPDTTIQVRRVSDGFTVVRRDEVNSEKKKGKKK